MCCKRVSRRQAPPGCTTMPTRSPTCESSDPTANGSHYGINLTHSGPPRPATPTGFMPQTSIPRMGANCLAPASERNTQCEALPAREYGAEVRLAQDLRDLRALVPLNLDLAILYCATRAASLLHRLGQLLLFRQTDADKTLYHCHRLAAAPGLLADNVHPATILSRWFGLGSLAEIRRRNFRCRREPFAGEGLKGGVTKALSTVRGNAFRLVHAFARRGRVASWVDGRPVGFLVKRRPDSSRCDDGTVSLGPAVAVELPHVAHFFDLVQVQVRNHHFVLVAAAHGAHLSAGVAEIGLAVKFADGPGLFDAHPVDGANKGLIGDGVGGLFEPPEILA